MKEIGLNTEHITYKFHTLRIIVFQFIGFRNAEKRALLDSTVSWMLEFSFHWHQNCFRELIQNWHFLIFFSIEKTLLNNSEKFWKIAILIWNRCSVYPTQSENPKQLQYMKEPTCDCNWVGKNNNDWLMICSPHTSPYLVLSILWIVPRYPKDPAPFRYSLISLCKGQTIRNTIAQSGKIAQQSLKWIAHLTSQIRAKEPANHWLVVFEMLKPKSRWSRTPNLPVRFIDPNQWYILVVYYISR